MIQANSVLFSKDSIEQACTTARVGGTAVYTTSRVDVVPVPLLHDLKHIKVLHQRIVLPRAVTRNKLPKNRIEVVHVIISDKFTLQCARQ